jgi:hypothetical protein
MRLAVGGLLLAAALLGAAGTSQAQTMPWPFSMCREGFTYDAKKDVCVEQKVPKAKSSASTKKKK